jgi:sterol desaturase/sphingolipid hydroxylase (fatty acid hydroxylase superfamily)
MCGYMAIMGLCGVIDHSGIKFRVPGIYDSADHDRHHSHYIVNYSFPFPYMDLLFGTFDGEFMGRRIRPWARAGLVVPEKSHSK